MNTLVLTLSLAFLVIGYSNGNNVLPQAKIEELNKFVMGKLKDQCYNRTSGNETVFLTLQAGIASSILCTETLFNLTSDELKEDIKNHNGSLENLKSIVRKSCLKKPELYNCIDPMITQVDPCLTEKELKSKEELVKVIKRLIEFGCTNDGEQIIRFFMEGGPECVENHKNEISECVQMKVSAAAEKSPNGGEFDIEALENKRCEILNELQSCAITELAQCTNDLATKLVNDVFEILEENCPTISNNITPTPSAGQIYNSSSIIFGISVMIIGSKFFAF